MPSNDIDDAEIQNQLLYRQSMPVIRIKLFQSQERILSYPVCPRCGVTFEREFQAYCDRCGQYLDWERFGQKTLVEIIPHKRDVLY